MRAWIAMEAFRDNLYDKALGSNMAAIYRKHLKAFEGSSFELEKTLSEMDPITMNKIDEQITAKCFGFRDAYDYHYS